MLCIFAQKIIKVCCAGKAIPPKKLFTKNLKKKDIPYYSLAEEPDSTSADPDGVTAGAAAGAAPGAAAGAGADVDPDPTATGKIGL